VLKSAEIVEEAKERLKGILVFDSVVPDYYAKTPKPCMGGWGKGIMNITPLGKVLPCHASETVPGLQFDNVRHKKLRDIWLNGQAFQAFRGTSWMKEPCKSCPRAEIDFGGFRCQAPRRRPCRSHRPADPPHRAGQTRAGRAGRRLIGHLPRASTATVMVRPHQDPRRACATASRRSDRQRFRLALKVGPAARDDEIGEGADLRIAQAAMLRQAGELHRQRRHLARDRDQPA